MAVLTFPILSVVKVMDGDTFSANLQLALLNHKQIPMTTDVKGHEVFDFGFRVFGHGIYRPQEFYTKATVRVCNTDSPEIHSDNPLEMQAAVVSQTFVRNWLDAAMKTGAAVLVSHGLDNYGRALGDVKLPGSKQVPDLSLSQDILKAGLARAYHGEKKLPWLEADLQRIANWKAPA